MSITSQTKKNFILNVKAYLENAGSDPYIKEQIMSIGYDENRLNEGRAFQQAAWDSREKQLVAMNQAKALHTQMEEIFSANYDSFLADSRLLRSTFIRDIPVKEKLGLTGRRKRHVASYIETARTFYDTLLAENEVLDKLTQFNFTPETIQAKLAGIAEVEKAYNAYKDADQEAQAATEQCEKEFKKLRDWIRVFQDACRIVLKEKSQLLEKVGILVRSAKPRKKEEEEKEGSADGSSDVEQEEAA